MVTTNLIRNKIPNTYGDVGGTTSWPNLDFARTPDPVNPDHYKKHKSGIECIDVVEHMSFNLGNAIKYIWRADLKEDRISDLKKAKWYIEREIERLGHGGVGE